MSILINNWQMPWMSGPYEQSIFTASSTPICSIGTIMRLADFRTFVYAKFSADLAVGMVAQTAIRNSHTDFNHNLAMATVAAGATSVAVTLDGSTYSLAAGELEGGFLTIQTGSTGVGYHYKIKTNTAAAVGAETTLTLYDPVQVAIDATATCSITTSDYLYPIIAATTLTGFPVGVSVCAIDVTAVTDPYKYAWLQTYGPGLVKGDGNGNLNAIGDRLFVSDATAGCCEVGAAAGQYTKKDIGYLRNVAVTNTDYLEAFLMIAA